MTFLLLGLGYEVFQPFGFDSHGLPTELFAKKIGKEIDYDTTLKRAVLFHSEYFRKNYLSLSDPFLIQKKMRDKNPHFEDDENYYLILDLADKKFIDIINSMIGEIARTPCLRREYLLVHKFSAITSTNSNSTRP